MDLIRLEAAKQTRGDKLTSGPSVSLSVRNSRSCNSVAFCTEDPNYLAVGLDKVRSDCSLVIWDITSSVPLLSFDPTNSSQDLESLVGSSRPQISVPRGKTNPRQDPRILQQYAPQEVVSCLTFLPKSTQLVLAGISYRWLRLFDLRSQAPNVLGAPGKIQALAADPFDQYRVASIGDNNIPILDTRRLTSALMFSERDAMADSARLRHGSVFSGVEFSSTRRGCLATLERDSAYVRYWDLVDTSGPASEVGLGAVGSPLRETGKAPSKRSWAATLSWQTSGQQGPGMMKQRTLSMDMHAPSLVLANTRRSMSSLFSVLGQYSLLLQPRLSQKLSHPSPLLLNQGTHTPSPVMC